MTNGRTVILCVDDESNPLVLRKLVLEKAGYEVITARSGKEALQLTGSRAFDLVLSDHLMPGMNGAELAQELKAQNPALPVILISGVNDIPPGANAADAFISKVEGPDVLGKRIAAVLERNKGQGQESSSANS
ncbi:MAG TPA: response regulator [Terriglobales bacterium]|nr:response regulator [Terriglobales bacterium]